MLSNDEKRTSAAVCRLAAMLTGAVLAVGQCACSNTEAKRPSAATRRSADATPAASRAEMASLLRVDADQDNDAEATGDDTNNDSALNFGHPANASDRHAIVALVKRYYRVALAGHGSQACAMIYSMLAEATPEDYGSFAAPAYMRGKTCSEVLSKQFLHFHALLAIEVPRLKVTRVRLERHHGRAILSFGPHLPEREILVQREGRTWRIAELLDGQLS